LSNVIQIVSLILVCISQIIILLVLFKTVNPQTKDEFLINLAVLDHVIDDYVQIILNTKLKSLGLLYNTDPESKLNAIKSYEKKINETIAQATQEVIGLLSKKTKKTLQKRFSDKSIALYITNKLRANI
jgi:hypothetical protein